MPTRSLPRLDPERRRRRIQVLAERLEARACRDVGQSGRARMERIRDGLVSALRRQAPQTTPVAFADVDDEFFVALRLDASGEPRALLSDVTAATEYDLADDVVDLLGEDPPDEGDDVWPAGDLGLF